MQLSHLSCYTLPRPLRDVPAKFPREPTQLRVAQPYVGSIGHPLSPFGLWLGPLHLLPM
jgi:hypothetical protein